jgi:hypothetical protein
MLGAGAVVVLVAAAIAAVWATSSAAPGRHPAPPASWAASGRTTAGHRPGTRPAALERLPVGTIGRYRVTENALQLVDRSRPRLGPRALPTTVWRPVIPASRRLARGLFPLMVFAPGFGECAASYGPLLRAWASAGYVVAGVDFPRTSCQIPNLNENDLVNQPADMAYVIRRLLAASGRTRGPLAGLINPGKIAVSGQSDGGDTVIALAADSCCRDHAVGAAIVLSGAEWPPMGGSYFTRATPPILFVQGDADNINPPPDSMLMYRADSSGPRFYLDLLGAGHLPPYQGQGPPAPVVARVTVDFLDRYLVGRPGAAVAMRRDGHVAGVATLVSGRQPPP